MKRFLRIVLGTVTIVLLGLFALTFVDINHYKPEIEALAEDLTGRTLQLEGPLHIGFSLRPTVIADKVTFGNASWGKQPHMFHAEEVALRLSLMSLLVGSVSVRELNVTGATLFLERRADGAGNWELGTGSAGETAGDEETSLQDLPQVIVDDLQLTYDSGRRGDVTEIFLERADIEPRGGGVAIGVRGSVADRIASASGYFEGNAEAFAVSNLKLAYDDLTLTGKLDGVRPTENAPLRVDGVFASSAFVVDTFIDQTGSATNEGSLFSDAPLPFSVLNLANGEIEVTFEELTYHSLDLKDVHIAVTLKDGAVSVPVFAEYEGHRLEAQLNANDGQQPQASMTLNAPGFDIGQFLKQVDATDLVDVRGHVGVDLSGRGQSVKALMSSLNGKVDIATGRGRIDSSVFELIAADLLWALIPKGSDAGVADLTCFINELNFSNGVGQVAALALVTDKIRTSGTGSINLASETIDMTLHPHPNDPGLLSLATPVNITGPLADPTILPDTTSVLGDIALSVGAGLLTGGVGAILPLISAESFDADASSACLTVLKGSSSSRSNEDDGLLDQAGEGAGDVIRGVGDILSSPFD